jgi:hypothetical protein
MSLTEIQDVITQTGIQPTLLQDAMMKQLNWQDQWIGYDDEETVAMKKQFANNMCFGGTMAWSVDFNSGIGDTDQPPVSTDGRCGPNYGGTVCEGSAFGDCCSPTSWCGSTAAYCGSGCQGGLCLKRAPTTDGTCGIGNYGSTCEGWAAGSCCSASGFCGNTEAYCGGGCQSGCDTPPTGDPECGDACSTPTTQDPSLQWKIDPDTDFDCTDDQKAKLFEAWDEAATLASILRYWYAGGPDQDSMTLYLGPSTAGYLWGTVPRIPLLGKMLRCYNLRIRC